MRLLNRHCRRAGQLGLLSGILLLVTAPALAHSPSPGLKGFWTGVLHPLTDPAQLLMIIAAILWLGLFPLATVKKHVLIFGGSCVLGLAIGLAGLQDQSNLLFGLAPKPPTTMINQAIMATACVAAFLAAAVPHRMAIALTAAIATTGLLAGYVNIPDPGSVSAFTVTLAGSIFSVGYLVFVGSIGIESLLSKYKMQWMPIAIRTGCAWIAAIAMLLLALQFTT